jgi:formylglycine-generating enzyme required for sulfatase activity
MVGFLLTNGNQNVAVFQSADALPHSSTGLYETLRVGGDFLSRNPDIPINVIVQNGGPDVTAAVIADDLYLRKYASFEPVPPTPTPIPIGQTIIIPLDLPEGAKPLEMVLISGGTFVMGSPNEEKDRGLDEGPQHLVTISQPFYMGKYEITQAQWKAVMGSNPSFWKGDNLPVEMVSWDDIQTFVQKINQLGEGTFRLPTEAEWEYACRAGTTSRYYWGDDLNYSQIIEYAWHRENSSSKTHEVGLMPPNTWELYDMSGNVWEWCQDWYGSSYYSQSVITDPTGPDSGINRVIRGGSWGSYAQYCRSALRYGWSLPSRRDNDGGFRLQRAYP